MMKRLLAALVIGILFIVIVALLFSRWWGQRTSLSNFPFSTPTGIVTPPPLDMKTTSLLRRLKSLAKDEKTVVFSPVGETDATGAIRYAQKEGTVSFTIAVTTEKERALTAWLVSSKGEVSLGILQESKGGMILNGEATADVFPATIVITRDGKNIRQTDAKVLEMVLSL
jgi:hypothetical protein